MHEADDILAGQRQHQDRRPERKAIQREHIKGPAEQHLGKRSGAAGAEKRQQRNRAGQWPRLGTKAFVEDIGHGKEHHAIGDQPEDQPSVEVDQEIIAASMGNRNLRNRVALAPGPIGEDDQEQQCDRPNAKNTGPHQGPEHAAQAAHHQCPPVSTRDKARLRPRFIGQFGTKTFDQGQDEHRRGDKNRAKERGDMMSAGRRGGQRPTFRQIRRLATHDPGVGKGQRVEQHRQRIGGRQLPKDMNCLGHRRRKDQPDRRPTRRFFAHPQLGKAIHADGHQHHRRCLHNAKGEAQIAGEKRDRRDGLLRKGWVAGQRKAGVPARVPMVEPTTRPVVSKKNMHIGIIGVAIGAVDAEHPMIKQCPEHRHQQADIDRPTNQGFVAPARARRLIGQRCARDFRENLHDN